MRNFILPIFLLAVATCSGVATAQQRVLESGTYVVRNLTTGAVGHETWHIEGVVDVEYDPDYRTRKLFLIPPYKPTATLQEEAFDRRTVTKGDVSCRITWWVHPSMMSHGDRTFGHVLVKNRNSNIPDKSYPIFYEVTKVGHLLLRLTSKTFLENGIVIVLEETYTRTTYHLPVSIVQRTLDPLEKVLEEIRLEKQ